MAVVNFRLKPLALALLTVILLFTVTSLYSKEESITFLPRNEDMQTIYKDYQNYPGGAKPLPQLGCQLLEADRLEYERCYNCVYGIKKFCPDCCLIIPHYLNDPRKIRCHLDYDPQYRCRERPFDASQCPQLSLDDPACPRDPLWFDPEPPLDPQRLCNQDGTVRRDILCQNKGCPRLEPNSSHSSRCEYDGINWLCEEDGLEPKFKGCFYYEESGLCPSHKKCKPCEEVSDYYLTMPIESENCPHPGNSPGPHRCYQYRPTPEFESCRNECLNYADERDRCTNRVRCCEESTCVGEDPPGYGNCREDACRKRVIDRSCDIYTASLCSEIQARYNSCLTGINTPGGGSLVGQCKSCFQEIDDKFNYSFIAKSREAMTIIWQMSTTPRVCDAQYNNCSPITSSETYFFSRVKVFDVTDPLWPREVHESMVHQKSMEAAFSIFCATQIPNGVLQVGRAYIIKVYYFLPQTAVGIPEQKLKVDLSSIRLIVIRTRQ